MRRIIVPVLLGVLAPVMVVACGSGTVATSADSAVGPSAADVGACPGGVERLAAPSASFLTDTNAWLVADGIKLDGPIDTADHDADEQRATVVNAKVLRPSKSIQDVPALVAVHESDANKASELLNPGGQLLLSVEPGSSDLLFASLAVSRVDGSVTFIGDCMYEAATAPLAAFVETQRALGGTQSATDVLLDVLANPGDSTAKELYSALSPPPDAPTAGWSAQEPNLRSVDPEVTPSSVIGSMKSFTISINVPDSWRMLPGRLCTKSDVGWNECYLLTAVPPGQPMTLSGYFVPGSPVDVVVLDGPNYTSAQSVALQLPADLLGRGDPIRLTGSAKVATEEGLLAGSADSPVLTLG